MSFLNRIGERRAEPRRRGSGRRPWLGGVLLLGALAVSPASAASHGALPPFYVTTLGGATASADVVASSALAPNAGGAWLYVEVAPHCPPCDRMLSALASRPVAAANLVLVMQGQADDVTRALALYPALSNAHWYLDSDGSAFQALSFQTRPTALGLRANQIVWQWAGASADPAKLASVLLDWLATGASS